jgi:hypothetical protein
LSAVIPHSDPETESERLAQPVNGLPDVRVGQLRNYNAARHRSIR